MYPIALNEDARVSGCKRSKEFVDHISTRKALFFMLINQKNET